ncbi:VOC family protein [Mucilaginibacter sp. HMF5004]|uniref:VOC family protein n=1 Tax=Mucilaginibacter rivuli TaxID=2857527 RepID=UPI001C5E3324|nr:VOC family protein [Mucilaginibacter rivuli]MBW4888838.1 VOC family protein [Mucilaginibacter rivuli]
MAKVTGIGGVFFKCKDVATVNNWYQKHLGFNTSAYGTNFEWRDVTDPEKKGTTVWSPFASDTKYFEPSQKEFMLNLVVDNLEELLTQLKAEGVTIVGEMQVYDYGKFAHIIDPEGNKIELWEAAAE